MKKPHHKYKKEINTNKINSIKYQIYFYCVNMIVDIIAKGRPFLLFFGINRAHKRRSFLK